MRKLNLTQRQARLLRDNLVGNPAGYDYLDLCRLDNLAKRLTVLQGDFGLQMAELVRQEKRIRRELARGEISDEKASSQLLDLRFAVEDLQEEADGIQVSLSLEDGDYKLVSDKVTSVETWLATDELRPVIIGMMEAIKSAEVVADDEARAEKREPVTQDDARPPVQKVTELRARSKRAG